MSQPTDDQLGAMLTDTFRAHEGLADPERAVGLASSPPPQRHRGRVLLAAGAAVAVVAVGTAYVVGQGTDRGRPSAGAPTPSPSGAGQPALPPLQTNAGNRAAAAKTADRITAEVPTYPGARPSSAIPELQFLESISGLDAFTVTRNTWLTVPGPSAVAVIQWYADHPTQGFIAGSYGPGNTPGEQWREFDEKHPSSADRNIVLIQATRVSGDIGVRVIVESQWSPARPLASYVQDVRSIDVDSTHQVFGAHVKTTRSSISVTDPAQVLQAARVFNSLPGHALWDHSCPAPFDVWTDRIVFHTGSGDVTFDANNRSLMCGVGLQVRRDGHRVEPDLGDPQQLLDVLGLDH